MDLSELQMFYMLLRSTHCTALQAKTFVGVLGGVSMLR